MTVTAPDRRGQRPEFATPDSFLARIGGLPLDTTERLAFPRTAAWANRLVDIEAELLATGERIADLLAAAVAAQPADSALRTPLINLRREVFNNRRPRDPSAATAVLAAGAPEVSAEYRDWLDSRHRFDDELAAGDALFALEWPVRRSALRDVAGEPALRHGLLLSSRTLDRQLPRYLEAGDAPLNKRARRVERSLLEYVYRAATKTSPFSTFTTVCEGSFDDGSGAALRLVREHAGEQHHVRLNVATLGRLANAVIARADIRSELPVRLVTGLRSGAQRLSYLRREARASRTGGAMELSRVHESLFHLPTSELMRDLTGLLGNGRTRPLRQVVDALVGLAPGTRSPTDVERYLDHLLRLGLLVAPALRVDIHHPDPLAGFRSALRDLDQPWAHLLADRLDAVDHHLSAYPAAGLHRRRDLLDAVGTELVRAHADLDQPDVTLPATLLYEDVVLPARVTADRRSWGRLTADLSVVAGVLPVFDVQLSRRLVTKGYFRARYGAGGHTDDLLTFAHEYLDDFFDHFVSSQLRRRPFDRENRYVPQANTFQLPEIDALDDAREAAGRLVNAAYAALPPDATELVLDDEFFTELRERVPATLGPVEAHGFFLQLARTTDGPLGVVNKAFTGPALMLSRFARWLGGDDGDLLARGLSAAQPHGVVFAELKGGHEDTNLNLHPAATPYELVCPGDISSRPADEQIAIDDLVLYDDPTQDRLVLRSRRLGVEVVPVYLGFLLPMALPEIQQVLMTFSPTGMAPIDLWAGTTVPLPDRGIVGYPRIRYRDVVLQRRMWKAHPDCLPTSAADAPGSQTMLAWARWRRRHGLPRRVFVTPDALGGAAGSAPSFGTHKPLYIDFDSYFSLNLLTAVARAAENRLVFTEMLPDHCQQWLTDRDGAHVSELVLAFNATPREAR
ncbi:lantibiotic dehydratase [Micromonospora tarensis]|uniref:Lantibiotic dehydratase n=1 Tax=Micromonospora tarensis TaxID=2806100 RepID=A0ABS1YC63_9ACTN|nr:lantibiotic dehydratase [Micromonospora tarensis]MBM0274986.1 lantibiotic dehydratase [Micromonospora tarensis]